MSTSPERTIRVVVADDHVPTRASLRRTLEAGGFDVCGEAASAASCVEQVRQTLPDLALVDVRMPGNGLRAATDIITLPVSNIVSREARLKSQGANPSRLAVTCLPRPRASRSRAASPTSMHTMPTPPRKPPIPSPNFPMDVSAWGWVCPTRCWSSRAVISG